MRTDLKRDEIAATGNGGYLLEQWAAAGDDGVSPVTRVEAQTRRRVLRQLAVITAEDAIDGRPGVPALDRQVAALDRSDEGDQGDPRPKLINAGGLSNRPRSRREPKRPSVTRLSITRRNSIAWSR
ncbi:MAG: hypothetical protein ABR571_09300 [Jatrophihabitans sp.]|uniref:hypothetical protein n=1 Tax=Jatrophihabitans sp. TaxID=1932789 RepID=UPI00390D9A2E